MNFGFPQFFWALLALSIPLLIHLFNLRRPKTVFFSNTRFLKTLEEQTKSVKRLKYWLILSLRLLALALIISAFALPFDGSTGEEKEKAYLHLYIDNSLSMSQEGAQGSLFNEALLWSSNLLSELDENVEVQIVNNDFNARYQRYYGLSEAEELLRGLGPNASHRSLLEILNRFRNLSSSQPEAQHDYILISDFQSSLFESDSLSLNPNERLQLLPLASGQSNQNAAIDSISLSAPVFVPGLDQDLKVYLRNYGAEDLNGVSLRFYLNDTLRNTQIVDLAAAGSAEVVISFSPEREGFHQSRLEMDKGAPNFDNSFYWSFQTISQQKVYFLSEESESPLPLQIFENDYFDLKKSSPENIDYDFFKESRLVILNSDLKLKASLVQQLNRHLEEGKNLWLFPGEDALGYGEQLKQIGINISGQWQEDSLMAQDLSAKDPFLAKSFIPSKNAPILPFSRKHLYAFEPSASALLSVERDFPLLSRKAVKNGQVFYSLTSINPKASNLAGHPIMIPLLANAALYGGQAPRYYVRAGRWEDYQSIEAPEMEQALEIEIEGQAYIPQQSYRNDRYELGLVAMGIRAGNYPVLRNEAQIAWFSLNSNPLESELKPIENLSAAFVPPAELLDPQSPGQLEELKAGILDQQQAYWPWFLAAALVLLLLEMLFLNQRQSHE